MRKELIVSLGELRYVCVSCQHCSARVTLDLKEKSAFTAKFGSPLAAKACPGCQTD